ncbi:MAG: pseudouridine synthase [Bacteroidales bacterium]
MEKRSTPGRASADKRTGRSDRQDSDRPYRRNQDRLEKGQGYSSRPARKSSEKRGESSEERSSSGTGNSRYGRPSRPASKTGSGKSSYGRSESPYPRKTRESRESRDSDDRDKRDNSSSPRPWSKTSRSGSTKGRSASSFPKKSRDSRENRADDESGKRNFRPGPRTNSKTRGFGKREEQSGSSYPGKRRDSGFGRDMDEYRNTRNSRFTSEDSADGTGQEHTEQTGYRSKRTNNPNYGKPYVKRASRDRDSDSKRPGRFSSEKVPKRAFRGSEGRSSSPAKRTTSRENKPKTSDEGGFRLNKYVASTGLCSRREADEMIKQGLISVNGNIVTELGVKIGPDDEVRFNGAILKEERKVYILLNKPKDVTTTTEDPHAKLTVLDLVRNACKERIFPVGRLDRSTTGVLLLTNDGELAKKLTHPKYNKRKVYHVFLDKKLKNEDFRKITDGVMLEDGFVKPDEMHFVEEDDHTQVGIEIHSGRNRIVRRIFEHFDYRIKKLDRVYFAGLTKKGVERGHWRFLTEREIKMLKTGAYE